MSGARKIELEEVDDEIRITGLKASEDANWNVDAFSEKRALVEADGIRDKTHRSGFSFSRLDVFVALLQGLVRQEFTGSISIDNDRHVKTIFFKKGRLIFARSDLIDDRLGEVIYRRGMITLDQMTEAAVQVNRRTKFGKVLIDSKQFSSADLWDALKMQVVNIFQSIFYNESFFYEIQTNPEQQIPTSVSFDRPIESMIEEFAAIGRTYSAFVKRLEHIQSISLTTEGESLHRDAQQQSVGTFIDDMLVIVESSASLEDILSRSKLDTSYTLATLLNLLNMRYIDIELSLKGLSIKAEPEMRDVKSQIDAYQMLLKTITKAFEEEELSLPLHEFHDFLRGRFQRQQCPLFLAADGSIALESIRNIYARSQGSILQREKMSAELGSLIQFVLQVTGDLLPDKGWEIKKSFQEMFP